METVLERLPPEARVVVIRLRSLGDCVLTTPALQLLKNFRPDLRIAVVVEDRFAPIFRGNPDVERTVPPPVRGVFGLRAGLCINLHGGTRSVPLSIFSGARFRAGFAHFRFPAIYNVPIPRAQAILGVERKVHTAEHLASAMFYLGVPRREIPRARLFARPAPRGGAYAVLHPFASSRGKTWPAERFLAVARHLEKFAGLEAVFLAGPGEDAEAFREQGMLAGAPLEEVKSLLAGASLFIGNDSGPAHMAAAFGVPAAVIFGGSDSETWAPWRAGAETFTASSAATIPLRDVLGAVERLLAGHATRVSG